jgi:hypothetical protein
MRRRKFGPLLGHRRDRHPCTVQVPAGGEGDIVVVDALVVPPPPLSFIVRHIASVRPLPGVYYDAAWPLRVILRP